jgi:DnaJ-class molecular chaperone
VNTDWMGKIRARAYAIWERLGRPEGAAERHWAQAEEELRAEGAGTTNPGDDAPPGTPGTGEDICELCSGSGQVDGKPCPNCGGSGKVVAGIGGA